MKYFLFFFITPFILISAQTDSIFVSDFNDALKVSADFYTSPLHYNSKDWITFSSVVGLTALATLADKEVKNYSQKNQSKFANNLLNIDKYYRLDYAAGTMILLYGYGLLYDNNKIRKLAVKLVEATALASSITLVSKITIGRARPFLNKDVYYTNSLNIKDDYNSFPSEHTTLAFAYSTVMANEIDNVFWKVGWYSAASLVGYARVYHNQHWFSDVLMGAAIGYFSGEFVSNHNLNEKETTQIKIFPAPNGIAVQIIF
jgi:membrane-associated phospholipid phosphatase